MTLTAAGTSKDSSTVTLKSPAAGNGGANMIQTIFSDYAPSPFPNGPVSVHSCVVDDWTAGATVLSWSVRKLITSCPCTPRLYLRHILPKHLPTTHRRTCVPRCLNPSTLLSQAEAPFSSVYRPAQPLSSLVAGASTAAGAGGSQGVWTLIVTDTAATK